MNGHAKEITVTPAQGWLEHHPSPTTAAASRSTSIPSTRRPRSRSSTRRSTPAEKFEGDNYKTSGGLHGVGASVVNALSTKLIVKVKRGGAEYQMEFKRGVATAPLKKLGPARGSGTSVFFQPDPTIFPRTEFDPAIIRERLEVASFLHRGVKVRFIDEAHKTDETFKAEQGIVDYLKKIIADRGHKPIHETPFTLIKVNGARPSRSPSSGPSRPTSTFVATSTASPPARAARTRSASGARSARRFATSSRPTSSRRAA